jgi:hypothetical protein
LRLISAAGLVEGDLVEIANQKRPLAPYWFCWCGTEQGVLTEAQSGNFVPMICGRMGLVRGLVGWLVFAALPVWMGAAAATAQDTPKSAPQPALPSQQTPPNPPATPPQQPDSGAQVRTGSVVGSGEGDLPARLTTLLGDHQFLEMERLLREQGEAASDSEAKITPEQKEMFRGVLANRANRPQESIRILEPVLEQMDKMKAGEHPGNEKLVRKTLAEDYLRTEDWMKASRTYQDLESKSKLSADEQEEMELPLKLLPLAAANPPMTVEVGDAFSLPYDRDALGLTDVPVFVDARSHDWMLDPTAPFNLICHSTAKEVGLKLSEQSAIVHTITGRPMQVHATLIPRFTLGTVTFRNMTAFVFEDADYYFPKTGYQVRGVLGYPAVSALGSLTVSADAKIEVQPGEKGEHLTGGAPFFLDGDRLIVALGKAGDERMFVVDAGGQQTYLSSRYYAEHTGEFADKKMQLLGPAGAENKPPAAAYVADSVPLNVGGTAVDFHYMQVLTQPLGASAVDDTYGTLGMDALDELKSYTFDYRTMRFAVKSE